MSKLLPIIGGLTAGTAVIGGTATYYLTKENPKPFKEQFNHSLISTGQTGNPIFKEKLAKLKVSTTEPNNAKLKEAKTKSKVQSAPDTAGLDELKQGCQEIYESNFTDKNSAIFKDFETYCSKNIKDAITKDKWALTDTSFSWKDKQNPKLTSSKSALVAELVTIKNKSTIGDDDLKNWCTSVENTLFEGSEDITFQNANEFCKKD